MKNSGFTLIELMIVIGLMIILSTIGIGSFTQSMVKSRDSQRKSNLNQIVKGLESFYLNIGRYPLSTSDNKIECYSKNGAGVVTNPTCTTKLYSSAPEVGSTTSFNTQYYIDLPSDPDTLRTYSYVSDGWTYALYAALESSLDKDWIKDGEGVASDWGLDCGSVKCNYKITETGQVKIK